MIAEFRTKCLLLLLCCAPSPVTADDVLGNPLVASSFLANGVTAHRGNSGDCPENTLTAFRNAIEMGADWIELDIFRTQDGKLVVLHDETTGRVGDKNLNVTASTFRSLQTVDVATEFRRRNGKTLQECPVERIPLLQDILRLVMNQARTRVSIQPKMNCVPEAIALVSSMQAERWVGFNDGSLTLMAEAKRLAPQIPVFWDRGADTNITDDIRIAKQNGFESLVLHHRGVTPEKISRIKAAGLEVGAWTVNEPTMMTTLLEMGVQRIYTDYPQRLLALVNEAAFRRVACQGTYPHHLQGVCTDEKAIYWCFTTTLVKTDITGNVIKQIPVANHHGDLCFHDGKLYVAVNLGKFNDPDGNADSWVYVYDAESLRERDRHETPQVIYGAGGIGYRDGHFFVVGGLPDDVEANHVFEYDSHFQFLKKHVIDSGHTQLGIQTATFAHDRWWFGCYGNPKILLATTADFQMIGRYALDGSLGIEGLSGGRLLVASGRCEKDQGCTGSVETAIPDAQLGFRFVGKNE